MSLSMDQLMGVQDAEQSFEGPTQRQDTANNVDFECKTSCSPTSTDGLALRELQKG